MVLVSKSVNSVFLGYVAAKLWKMGLAPKMVENSFSFQSFY